jgi:protein-S-isoprenylcysteine O-methyltransferase Ste14
VITIFDKALRVYYSPVKLLAWLGGGAFACSLGYLAYFYLVTLAVAAPHREQAAANTLFNIALFSVFALHHSLFARTWAKRILTWAVPRHYERTMYVWVASLLLIGVCAAWRPLPGIAYTLSDGWQLVGWSVQLGGALLVVSAARAMDPLGLAGIRQAEGRGDDTALRIVGPFRVVRHPIYLGWILMVFGTPTLTTNRLVFAVVSSAYLILAIPWEEKSLVAAHGGRYRVYQQAVRWRVVPGIW